ncbi:MAG: imelysin family protein [Myxococcota bacterium]|nr:imelysin family protein [Myxococcota bacterium]
MTIHPSNCLLRCGQFVTLAAAMLLALGCESSDMTTTNGSGSQNLDAGTASESDGFGPAGGGDSETVVEVSRESLLRSLSDHVFKVTYTQFAEKSASLSTAINAWQVDLSDDKHEAAKAAWIEANALWQHLEVMQVGPAGIAGRRVGGQDLRDAIYSYPVSNPCRVDQEVEAQRFTGAGWADRAQYNVRGLDAIEYLLFWTDTGNQCPDSISLNRQGRWDRLVEMGIEEVQSRRAALAATLATSLQGSADALAAAWATDKDFSDAFVSGTEPFEDAKQSLDEVYAGLFYLDKFVKDLKLGKPAGITPDCEAESCPDAVESKFADVSKENLINNLLGIRLVMLGGNDESFVGFDDLLVAEGAGELASTMMTKLQTAIDALNSIEGSLADAIRQNLGQVTAAYDAV